MNTQTTQSKSFLIRVIKITTAVIPKAVLLTIVVLFSRGLISAQTQRILNKDFNLPAQVNYGNNFVNPTSWTISTSPNLVKVDGNTTGGPHNYADGPEVDGSGGAGQYLDIASVSADFYQIFTIGECGGTANFYGYFSYRNFGTGGPSFVTIRKGAGATGAIVAQSTSLPNSPNPTATGPDGILGTADDGQGQGQHEWTRSTGSVTLTEGTYSFVITMGDFANFDRASLITTPIVRNDWGDAPDSYQTLNASGGPFHCLSDFLYLGTGVDNENDGQPNAAATGDSNEDAITWPTLNAGATLNINTSLTNITGSNGYINAWIDFNADGDFNDAGEQITSDQVVPNGATSSTLSFTVPSVDAGSTNSTFARVRICDEPSTCNTPIGNGERGEVEDYLVSSTLPVELLYFTANKDGDNALLTWATATEENNSHFEVEYSSDGNNWNLLTTAQGNGTTYQQHNYSIVDYGPYSGVRYYRLKQVDFDGSFTHFSIQLINFSTNELRIFPNPSKDVLNISSNEGIVAVTLYDMTGRLILHRNNGEDMKTGSSTIDISHLVQGMYVLVIENGKGERVTEKLVKQ